jgi:hypothetical protein
MRASRLMSVLVAMFCIAGASAPAQAGPFTFATLPANGDIAGAAGTTIGWGYTLANPSATDWLVLSGVSADVFQQAVSNAFLFDFPILAPNAGLASAYVTGTAGLFELTWDPAAPVGFVNTGTFMVSAEWWSGDPFVGGSFLGMATDQTASYSATVTPPASVPEPPSLILLTTGLVAFGYRLRCGSRNLRTGYASSGWTRPRRVQGDADGSHT